MNLYEIVYHGRTEDQKLPKSLDFRHWLISRYLTPYYTVSSYWRCIFNFKITMNSKIQNNYVMSRLSVMMDRANPPMRDQKQREMIRTIGATSSLEKRCWRIFAFSYCILTILDGGLSLSLSQVIGTIGCGDFADKVHFLWTHYGGMIWYNTPDNP